MEDIQYSIRIEKTEKELMPKELNITMDKTSKWNLTGDSYVSNLEIEDVSSIQSNGYTVYCKSSNKIVSGEMELPGGGKLVIL